MRRVTLLTDFGTADGYVAAMKGVIAGIAPRAMIDDASHDIPPGDVRAAAWALAGYWRFYPPGSVHIVVVDPGVGTSRRPLACEVDDRFLVGPDNGVFTHVLRAVPTARVFTIDNDGIIADAVSATFHGRDIFAPAAAQLLRGVPLHSFGAAVSDPVLLPERLASRDGGAIRGEVVHADRFGNLITNIPRIWLAPGAAVRIAGTDARLVRTYGEGDAGEVVALVGSRDLLEIAVRNGSAAARFPEWQGLEITVE